MRLCYEFHFIVCKSTIYCSFFTKMELVKGDLVREIESRINRNSFGVRENRKAKENKQNSVGTVVFCLPDLARYPKGFTLTVK